MSGELEAAGGFIALIDKAIMDTYNLKKLFSEDAICQLAQAWMRDKQHNQTGA